MSNAHNIDSSLSLSMVGCTVNIPTNSSESVPQETPVNVDLHKITTRLERIIDHVMYERTTIVDQLKKWKQEMDANLRDTRMLLMGGRQDDDVMDSLKQLKRVAQEEIDTLKKELKKQHDQMEAYQQKCEEMQQLIETQQENMSKIRSDYANIREQITDIQIKFDARMVEVTPITDMMIVTQMKIQDCKFMQNLVESHVDQLTKQMNSTWEQEHGLEPISYKTPEGIPNKEDEAKMYALLNQELLKLAKSNDAFKHDIKILKDEGDYPKFHEMININPQVKLDDNYVSKLEIINKENDGAAMASKIYDSNEDTYLVCKIPNSNAESDQQMDTFMYRIKSVVMSRKEVENRLLVEHLTQDFSQIDIDVGQSQASNSTQGEEPSDSNSENNEQEEMMMIFENKNGV